MFNRGLNREEKGGRRAWRYGSARARDLASGARKLDALVSTQGRGRVLSRWQAMLTQCQHCTMRRVCLARRSSDIERAGIREKRNSASPSLLTSGAGAPFTSQPAREERELGWRSWCLVGLAQSRASLAATEEEGRRGKGNDIGWLGWAIGKRGGRKKGVMAQSAQ